MYLLYHNKGTNNKKVVEYYNVLILLHFIKNKLLIQNRKQRLHK